MHTANRPGKRCAGEPCSRALRRLSMPRRVGEPTMQQLIYDKDRVGPWVCKRTGGTYSPVDASAIGMLRDGRLVAGCLFEHFNGASIAMHVGSDGPHWLSRTFLRAVFRYPFVQLGVRKVLGFVDASNAAAQRFDEHLGFVLEATLTDAAPGGDLLIYTMRREQCRFLEL